MKQLLLYINISLLSACVAMNHHQSKELNNTGKFRVIEIKEFSHSYRLVGIDSLDNKVLLISSKKNHQKIAGKIVDTISINKSYYFQLTRIKPTVSTMEELGAFIVIESDTLWRASSYKEIPPTYSIHNSVGLLSTQID